MLSINDRSIINGRKSMTEIARFRPNETITLQILREGKELTINAKIGERPRIQE